MFGSLLLDSEAWDVHTLAEDAILLAYQGEKRQALKAVHRLFKAESLIRHAYITDRVAGYNSLALYFDADRITAEELITELQSLNLSEATESKVEESTEIPVCYELGTDWEEVEHQSGLSRDEIIEIHRSGSYTVAFVGFMPGFTYLDGLDHRLQCRRKEDPETRVPAGSVGIGGMFTGIYSRPSPGGWQIIGRTPLDLFDEYSMPPLKVNTGSKITFRRISKAEFKELSSAGDDD